MLTFVSESFTGEWPAGVFWVPGESREVRPELAERPPEGVCQVVRSAADPVVVTDVPADASPEEVPA